MPAVIILNINEDQCPADQYPITFSGTRDACRGETHHNGQFVTWAKSEYSVEMNPEPKSLFNGAGNADAGRIVTLRSL